MLASIPQIDGNISMKSQEEEDIAACLNYNLDGPDLEITRSVTDENSLGYKLNIPEHFDGVSPGQLCGFCDQEYSVLDEFSDQLKRFGYICNNCLDHFSDMPWFTTAEAGLTYIRVGAVLTSSLSVPVPRDL